MKPTIKSLLFGGLTVLTLLLTTPAVSDAHPWWGGPWYSYGYYGRPYGAYYNGWQPYSTYYYGQPGVQVYGYWPRYYHHDYYYHYRPRGAVRVGPLGVWW